MTARKLKAAQPRIAEALNSIGRRVFSHADLRGLLDTFKQDGNLPEGLSIGKFIDFLLDNTQLKKDVLQFPHRRETRYCWGDVSVYQIAQSLNAESYFTHFVAMHVHGLTDQIPKTIYINVEQPRGSDEDATLEQNRIKLAFNHAPRVSHNVAVVGDWRVCLLNGRQTGALGVVQGPDPLDGRSNIRFTDLERTLIDIVVRPFYAGGVFEVLNAYRRARAKANVELLVEMLRRLKYVYPYHQAVGFYLEKAGYPASEIRSLREFGLDFDFYLTFQMKQTDYSSDWRLFVPKGF